MASVSGSSTRAGRYVAQPTGYRAFIPAPLPPREFANYISILFYFHPST